MLSGLLTSGCRGVFLLNQYFIVHDLTSRFQQWPKFTTNLLLHFIFPKYWETDTSNERHLNWEEVSSERSQHRLMSTEPTKARESPCTAQKTYACATRKHYQRWTVRSVAMGTPLHYTDSKVRTTSYSIINGTPGNFYQEFNLTDNTQGHIQELNRHVTLIGSGKETTRNFKLLDS